MKIFCNVLKSSLLLVIAVCGQETGEDMVLSSSKRITSTVLAVSKVLPSVVNISTERIVNQSYHRRGRMDPFADIFNRFFGFQEKHYKKTSSLGSGVIVDADGLIITNNHVIQRASKIIVTLSDGKDYEAKPIANDEENDLALLQLEGFEKSDKLHAVQFAVPDDLYLGEKVITVGNPYGLGHSVAAGILSAKGRKVIYNGNVLFDDIIQTDAAINPGNSGGPLVNADGELIGINLAIHEEAEGIGFAIPLKRIEELLSSWLVPSRFGLNICGIIPGTMHAEGAQYFAVIKDIIPDSPAEKANLKKGDIIQSINDVEVHQAIDVGRILWKMIAGNDVKILLDNGSIIQFEIALLPELSGEELAEKKLHVELQQLTDRLADALGLPHSRGLVVSGVNAKSVLARRGVQRGDVIIQVGEIPITDFTDLSRALNEYRNNEIVEFVVDRVDNMQGHILLRRYVLEIPLL